MYKFLRDGVHAEVLDFPGAISCAANLGEARLSLARALAELAATLVRDGQTLPIPNPMAMDAESDIEELIELEL